MRLLLNRDPAPRVERLRSGFRVVDEPETEAAGADSVAAPDSRPSPSNRAPVESRAGGDGHK
jgi:hypothetical protein